MLIWQLPKNGREILELFIVMEASGYTFALANVVLYFKYLDRSTFIKYLHWVTMFVTEGDGFKPHHMVGLISLQKYYLMVWEEDKIINVLLDGIIRAANDKLYERGDGVSSGQ